MLALVRMRKKPARTAADELTAILLVTALLVVVIQAKFYGYHFLLALPAASIMMMLLAVPLAFKGTRVTSLASGIGLGFALGFAYFVVLAFTRALGQSHALPPALAAWSANGLFGLIGSYLILGEQ